MQAVCVPLGLCVIFPGASHLLVLGRTFLFWISRGAQETTVSRHIHGIHTAGVRERTRERRRARRSQWGGRDFWSGNFELQSAFTMPSCASPAGMVALHVYVVTLPTFISFGAAAVACESSWNVDCSCACRTRGNQEQKKTMGVLGWHVACQLHIRMGWHTNQMDHL